MAYVISQLDHLHAGVQRKRVLWGLTWCVRVVMALAFLPAGLGKAVGVPFTSLPISDEVGYFFDALLRTGFFYQFIGICQVVAALLLLTPWTATLGALAYLPIACGMFALTVSMNFGTTYEITGLLLLANLYLLCWDYDKLKPIFRRYK